jgi:hypothetical protein
MTDDREARVRDRAHALWESEDCPEGRDVDHWLKAEAETDAEGGSGAHPDDVDHAAGPSRGDEDFGGHDAEAEGAAATGVGGQHYQPGAEPRQVDTEEPEAGEEQVTSSLPKP